MISQLYKINIISLKAHKQKTLSALQNLGQTEIRSIKQKTKKFLDEKIENLKLKLSNIEFALNFLKDYQQEKKKSIWEKLNPEKKEYTVKQIKEKYQTIDLTKIIAKTKKAEENINSFQNELVRLIQQKTEIAPWRNINVLSTKTKHFKIIFGKALLNNYLELLQELEKQIKNNTYEIIYQDNKFVYLRIVYDKNQNISQILSKYKFEMQKLSWENPKQCYQNLKSKILNLKSNLKFQIQELRALSNQILNLGIAYDYLSFKKDKLEAQKRILSTRYFNIIGIWVTKQILPKLKKQLQKIDKNIILQKEKITGKDKPPVIIKNNNFVSPFESVTGIYGLPKFQELDPTPYLAPFFILFFALSLTDAGYGLVMAILCFAAIKIMKIPRESQKLFRLLIYAGIFTFFIGAIFGGWFGINLEGLPESSIKNFLLKIRLINPMTDTLLFMGLTFVLGFIQIWFSQIVKLHHAIKAKLKDNIWQASAWLVFLTSLPLTFFLKSIWPALICFLGLIMLNNLNVKIFLRPFIGVISVLQGLIGFMSDILSYSRLMALGLATGIIGFIINIIAGIFRDMIPIFGWGIWVLALIAGHLFNIGINALGGFIHSARLQFVEFFPKFLEGGGKKFEPFQYKAKFVIIKNKRSEWQVLKIKK